MSTSSYSSTDGARRVRYRRRQEEKRQQQQPLLRASSASPTIMMTSISSPPTSPPQPKSTTKSQSNPHNSWNQRRNRLPMISPSPASPSRSWDEGDTRPPSPGGGGRAWLRSNNTTAATKTGGNIFRRVKSSPGVVESLPLDEDDLDEQSSVASSRRSSSGDAADETITHSVAPSPLLPTSSPLFWDSRFVEVQEKALLQQRDNTRSLKTIQQLLTNVQAERDQALSKLDVLRQQRADSPLNDSSATSMMATDESSKVKAMADRIAVLEKELRAMAPNSPLLTEEHWKNEEIDPEIDEEVVRQAGSECDSIETSPSLVSTTNSSNHVQSELMRKELHEKTTALETAKMIIGSLEKRSGSQATELKTKVRQKDEEIQRLKKESAEKQKTLDALAIELRDVQRRPHEAPTQAESIKRVQLSTRLEANLADIQAAAVILESTQDPAAVSSLSELLTDSASVLRDGIAAIENGVAEHPSGRSFNLWRELEEKKKAVRNLEQSLVRQEENFRHLRKQRDVIQMKLENENEALHTEVRILRQQCITNMEILTKKERELVVLRDSLKVEDDVGYISDDEEEEADDGQIISSSTPAADTTMMLKSEYGHSQTEALATLLATGGNRSFDSCSPGPSMISTDQLVQQLSSLKTELSKTRSENEKTKRQLQVEKESLLNAKKIISSLEKANKKMMEDLRARLQDSNSAIASLLEKSLDSEKTNSKLRSEIEGLKRGRITAQEEVEPVVAIPPPPAIMELEETID